MKSSHNVKQMVLVDVGIDNLTLHGSLQEECFWKDCGGRDHALSRRPVRTASASMGFNPRAARPSGFNLEFSIARITWMDAVFRLEVVVRLGAAPGNAKLEKDPFQLVSLKC